MLRGEGPTVMEGLRIGHSGIWSLGGRADAPLRRGHLVAQQYTTRC